MRIAGGNHEDSSVFFPSLSNEILWTSGVVSRVRSAAQERRALDTAPDAQTKLLGGKRREGVANETGGHQMPPKFKPMTPYGLNIRMCSKHWTWRSSDFTG